MPCFLRMRERYPLEDEEKGKKGKRWKMKRDGGGERKKKRKEINKHTEVEWWSSSECFVCSPREVGVAVSMPFKIIICNLPEYACLYCLCRTVLYIR